MEVILINLHALNGHFDRGVRKPLFLPLLRSCGILKDCGGVDTAAQCKIVPPSRGDKIDRTGG